jgi:hypothetical protein
MESVRNATVLRADWNLLKQVDVAMRSIVRCVLSQGGVKAVDSDI